MRKLVVFFVAFMCIGLTINAQVDLENGLVGYYPFNGNANDESGNDLNGVVNGATYPVPANDVLTISGLTNKAELSIYSLAGQLLKQQTVDNGNINISDLSKGVYVVKIRSNNNILTTQRIVIQ